MLGMMIVAVMAVLIALWAGARYGSRVWRDAVLVEQKAADVLRRDRDAAIFKIERMKAAAVKAGLDLKTVFPFLVMLLMIAFAVGARAQAHYRQDGAYKLPDARFTPGAADLRLIADTSGARHMVGGLEANLCAKDFRTGPWRKVSESEKKAACRAYGIAAGCPGPKYELDHLISLEIGGSDGVANLWPQPIAEARIKDHQVEDVLPKLICAGKMALAEAQKCVASDWARCSREIASLQPPAAARK